MWSPFCLLLSCHFCLPLNVVSSALHRVLPCCFFPPAPLPLLYFLLCFSSPFFFLCWFVFCFFYFFVFGFGAVEFRATLQWYLRYHLRLERFADCLKDQNWSVAAVGDAMCDEWKRFASTEKRRATRRETTFAHSFNATHRASIR